MYLLLLPWVYGSFHHVFQTFVSQCLLLGYLPASRLPPPSPLAPLTPAASPYSTVLIISCSHFSVQKPTLGKFLFLVHHPKSPRNAPPICLPGITLHSWKKRPVDHNLFHAWASYKLSRLSVPIHEDGTSIPHITGPVKNLRKACNVPTLVLGTWQTPHQCLSPSPAGLSGFSLCDF